MQTDVTLLMNFSWQVLTVSCHAHTGTVPSDGFEFIFNFCVIGGCAAGSDRGRWIRGSGVTCMAVVISIILSLLYY